MYAVNNIYKQIEEVNNYHTTIAKEGLLSYDKIKSILDTLNLEPIKEVSSLGVDVLITIDWNNRTDNILDFRDQVVSAILANAESKYNNLNPSLLAHLERYPGNIYIIRM